ncbi:hypothetical protein CVV26_00350 [Candidatus Kuenenbacteria bacterium HGW-Kuenenbacteria-1]|uniref:Uncharacterized protein n=1 Tax=Candidatus Kuenenbacteria bacterium HGW-Kuenenbacteria-1 TaxID=2013812 RepID=A0A2N1UP82_9BACT|nr:MAG: hypothetical protein CVV26_00350 [Candidatus Kuenenbacteria bacterium HGW-Kuenenbacteria-1]
MPTNFLTNIDWSSPTTIGIAIIAVIAIGGYLWWAWSEKSHPSINKSISDAPLLKLFTITKWSVS